MVLKIENKFDIKMELCGSNLYAYKRMLNQAACLNKFYGARTITKSTFTIYTTKTQTNKPILNLEGLLMPLMPHAEFKNKL